MFKTGSGAGDYAPFVGVFESDKHGTVTVRLELSDVIHCDLLEGDDRSTLDVDVVNAVEILENFYQRYFSLYSERFFLAYSDPESGKEVSHRVWDRSYFLNVCRFKFDIICLLKMYKWDGDLRHKSRIIKESLRVVVGSDV